MRFESIDLLQRTLADTVFQYTSDRKKAAGRALGTLVEIITFYTLHAWGFLDHVVMERKVPEFANPDILHNVDFSLHRLRSKHEILLSPTPVPLTAARLKDESPFLGECKVKPVQVLSRDSVKRNSAVLLERESGMIVANIRSLDKKKCNLAICDLFPHPFAIFECKRVGVQEGMKKGPQTIEKAKQGSYVARSVSSLQKVRLRNGGFQGIIERPDGNFRTGPYSEILEEAINAPLMSEFPGFVLTVGVISNHGNWFASENYNKELRILAQSYDWLLFLQDNALSQFIDEILLNPKSSLKAASKAFLESYSGGSRSNKFTKIRMDAEADAALQKYFLSKGSEIETWFNVVSPYAKKLSALRRNLKRLATQDLGGN